MIKSILRGISQMAEDSDFISVLSCSSQYFPVKICFRKSLQKLAQTRVFHPVRPGYWVQFSTSNNSTSLFDHWLLYRHCAKLNLPAPTDGPLDSHQNHIFGEKERDFVLVIIKSFQCHLRHLSFLMLFMFYISRQCPIICKAEQRHLVIG